MMWTLDSALGLVRRLEHHLSPRWHIALAGGVLIRGESQHDLDVVIFPHTVAGDAETPMGELREALQAFGLSLRAGCAAMHAHWRTKGSDDEKTVEVWSTADGRRIDVLVLR